MNSAKKKLIYYIVSIIGILIFGSLIIFQSFLLVNSKDELAKMNSAKIIADQQLRQKIFEYYGLVIEDGLLGLENGPSYIADVLDNSYFYSCGLKYDNRTFDLKSTNVISKTSCKVELVEHFTNTAINKFPTKLLQDFSYLRSNRTGNVNITVDDMFYWSGKNEDVTFNVTVDCQVSSDRVKYIWEFSNLTPGEQIIIIFDNGKLAQKFGFNFKNIEIMVVEQ